MSFEPPEYYDDEEDAPIEEEMFFDPDAPAIPLNVDEARELVEELASQFLKLKADAKELKERKAELSARAEVLKRKLVDAKLPGFRTENFEAIVKEEEFFNCPADVTKKAALFEYLQKRGVYFSMTKINPRTLTKWVKGEIASAVARQDFDFRVPGVSDPFKKISIDFKHAKKRKP